jgi:hypothetical protein
MGADSEGQSEDRNRGKAGRVRETPENLSVAHTKAYAEMRKPWMWATAGCERIVGDAHRGRVYLLENVLRVLVIRSRSVKRWPTARN